MTHNAIQYMRNALNQYLIATFNLDETIVIANRIVDQQGVMPIENKNKVVLSLIHVEQEGAKLFKTISDRLSKENYLADSSPEQYSIYMLVTSSFDDYNETLKFLDTSMSFFKKNPVIDRNTVTNFPDTIDKLYVEYQHGEDYMQVQNVWTTMGARYQPSVIYKIRLLTAASNVV